MSEGSPRPELCVGAIAVDDERLLLIRRGTPPEAGYWSLPGGRVEHGETMAQAVIRELAEECGLDGICGRFVGWVERIGDGFHFAIFDFEVAILEPEALNAGDDASDAAWVELHAVAELPLVDGLAEFLAEHGFISTIV